MLSPPGHHIASRQCRGLWRKAQPQSLHQGLNSILCHSRLPVFGMDSLCSSSSWHWASGWRTLLLPFPFVFFSYLSLSLPPSLWDWRLMGRKGKEETGAEGNPRNTSRGSKEMRTKREKWLVHALCGWKLRAPCKCSHDLCTLRTFSRKKTNIKFSSWDTIYIWNKANKSQYMTAYCNILNITSIVIWYCRASGDSLVNIVKDKYEFCFLPFSLSNQTIAACSVSHTDQKQSIHMLDLNLVWVTL